MLGCSDELRSAAVNGQQSRPIVRYTESTGCPRSVTYGRQEVSKSSRPVPPSPVYRRYSSRRPGLIAVSGVRPDLTVPVLTSRCRLSTGRRLLDTPPGRPLQCPPSPASDPPCPSPIADSTCPAVDQSEISAIDCSSAAVAPPCTPLDERLPLPATPTSRANIRAAAVRARCGCDCHCCRHHHHPAPCTARLSPMSRCRHQHCHRPYPLHAITAPPCYLLLTTATTPTVLMQPGTQFGHGGGGHELARKGWKRGLQLSERCSTSNRHRTVSHNDDSAVQCIDSLRAFKTLPVIQLR